MSLFTQGLGEVWGAISQPIDTLKTAGTNLWHSISWNIGYVTGTSNSWAGDPRQEVQQQIDEAKKDEQKFYDTNPGSTPQDYTQYLQDTFPERFGNYVGQPNTGTANNAVSNFDPEKYMKNLDQYAQLGIFALIVIFVITLFRR